MKKLIALYLIATMSLFLIACGEKEPTSNSNVSTSTLQSTETAAPEVPEETETSEAEISTTEESPETEAPQILIAFDGVSPKIPYASFVNYLEVVEITADNWKQYFTLFHFEEDDTYDLIVGKGFCYDMVDFTLEVKVVKEASPLYGEILDGTSVLITPYDNAAGLEYTIDDFEFVSSQGTLIIANVPEELWGTAGDDIVVYIGTNSGEQWWRQGREAGLKNYLD